MLENNQESKEIIREVLIGYFDEDVNYVFNTYRRIICKRE